VLLCVLNRRSSVTQMVKSLGQVSQANVFLFSFLIPNCKCGWWTASVAIWFSILRDSGWGRGIISKIPRGKRQADVNKIKDFFLIKVLRRNALQPHTTSRGKRGWKFCFDKENEKVEEESSSWEIQPNLTVGFSVSGI